MRNVFLFRTFARHLKRSLCRHFGRPFLCASCVPTEPNKLLLRHTEPLKTI
jgi:hypothetical protein